MSGSRRRAFSLVEIALALGIMAFALLAIVSLLPAGLKMLRDSEEDTATSLIFQDVSARLERYSARPSAFRDTTARTVSYLYDGSGLFLAESTTAADPVAPTGYKQLQATYLAKVKIGPLASYPENVSESEMLGVNVEIYNVLRPQQNGTGEFLTKRGFYLPMGADDAWPRQP